MLPGLRVVERMVALGPENLGWDWGAGLLGDALGEWEEVWGGRGILKFLRDWSNHHARMGTAFHDAGGWHWKAGAGTTLLRVESRFPSAARRKWIAELGRHVLECPCWKDGTWLTKPERKEIWVDTLAMASPFLARAGSAGFGKGWVEESVTQIIAHAERLLCKDGLWMHAWNLGTRRPMGRFWARGNGWALHAMVETLAMTGTRSAPALTGLLAKTCEGLLAVQSPCGTWHTVLDEPSTYVETSGQALLVRGLARAARLRLIPKDLRARVHTAACRGWVAVGNHVSDEGIVTGTSLGTSAGPLRDYAGRPTASWPVWGPASVILAACEIAQLRQV